MTKPQLRHYLKYVEENAGSDEPDLIIDTGKPACRSGLQSSGNQFLLRYSDELGDTELVTHKPDWSFRGAGAIQAFETICERYFSEEMGMEVLFEDYD